MGYMMEPHKSTAKQREKGTKETNTEADTFYR